VLWGTSSNPRDTPNPSYNAMTMELARRGEEAAGKCKTKRKLYVDLIQEV